MKHFSALLIFIFAFQQISKSQNPAFIAQNKNRQEQMGFIENKGQIADKNGNVLNEVLFQAVGTGPQIFVTTSGLTYVFHQRNFITARKDEDNPVKNENWSKIEMCLSGATIKKENIEMENELPGFSNFYYAHCPDGILNVKSFHKIVIHDIYPNIDWVLNADDKSGMSHDFIVHPGGDASKIKEIYKGTNGKLVIDDSGRLVLQSLYGNIYEGQLNVYEEESGKKITAAFSIANNITSYKLGIKLKAPTTIGNAPTIVIDPPLQWTMPQSSTDFDYGYAISAAHDGSGDVLLTGESDGTDFPTLNAYQGFLSGFQDMVVVRLNATGTRLWSTYYGGTNFEQGKGVASDNSGNCYVIGTTGSSNMPVLNSLQANFGGGTYDAMIVKFNSAGVRQWASWRGGTMNDYGTAITSDLSGNIYITGYTNSTTFPVLNAIQSSKATGNDAFIMSLNSSQVMQWSTFFGGNDDDKGRGICLDATATNVYVTGSALSGSFPTTAGVFQFSNANAFNAEDAFILKMSTAQVVQFCSFCGGTDADFGQGVAVDNTGRIYITGYTLSSDFPCVNPGNGAYFDNSIGTAATHDAFIVECNSTGTTRTWSTYFGGSSPDLGMAIATDPFVGIYVCGNTASTDFPMHQPLDNVFYQSVQGDAGNFNDMFIAWFGTNDSLKWSTYYGDASSNEAYGICVDAMSNIFVTGVDNNDIGVLKFNPGFPLGINQSAAISSNEIFIYPNPASSTLFLELPLETNSKVNIEVFDIAGKSVLHEEQEGVVGENKIPLDISTLAKGAYMIRFSVGDFVQTTKFMKE